MAESRSTPSKSQPKLGDPLANPRPPFPLPPEASEMIDSFLKGKGPLRPTEVAWPIDRKTLREILAARAKARAFTPGEASRVSGIIETYLFEPFSIDLLEALKKQELSADDISVSAWLIRAGARAATADFIPFAVEYFQELAKKPAAEEAWRAMLDAKEALGPAAPADPVVALLDARAKKRLAQKNDYDAQIEGRSLEGIRNNDVQDMAWSDRARQRVEKIEAPAERLNALIDIYLERTNDGGFDYLLPWTVLSIRRHANTHGRDTVVARFVYEADRLRRTRESDEDAAFITVRCLRAIDFFEAPLKEDDIAFLEEFGPRQKDLLSRTLLWPHEHH